MLERVWIKGNSLALLVGMYIETSYYGRQHGDSFKN